MHLPDTVAALFESPHPIADLGEKRLIEDIVRPLFNPERKLWGVGDDAALLSVTEGSAILVSTDRVPADLISFRYGLIDHKQLGAYLARLNLSDIAACGGRPTGLLLNMGLPETLATSLFIQILIGALEVCQKFDCPIIGGDLSSSHELSLSATALGEVEKKYALTRGGAQAGDTVFASRPIGLTPAAFRLLRLERQVRDTISERDQMALWEQFRCCDPMFTLAKRLLMSKSCSACIDNTDGLAQSLYEIADASNVGIIVDEGIAVPDIVSRVALLGETSPLELGLEAGADFSLVGTMRGEWSQRDLTNVLGSQVQKIGITCDGQGVYLTERSSIKSLTVRGWNYYTLRA